MNGQSANESYWQFVNNCSNNNTNIIYGLNIKWILASNSDNDPDQNYQLL